MSNILCYNSPSGTSNILAFNTPGGTQNSFMSPSVSGAVLAYSYLYSNTSIFPNAISADPGGNVYVGGQLATLTAPTFPNSIDPRPAPHYSFFPSGSAGAFLLKYNKFGKMVGFLSAPGATAVSQIVIDAQSNVYISMTLNTTLNIGDLDPTNPVTNTQTIVGGGTPVGCIIKYSPTGKLIASGGMNCTGTPGLSLDAGSNVYVVCTVRNNARQNVYNIANPATLSGFSIVPTLYSGGPAIGVFWNYLLKFSPTGTYLGYTVIPMTVNSTTGSGYLRVTPDATGNIYVGGTISSNIYGNVNSISTSDPSANLYSLNRSANPPTVAGTGSNAFVVQFGPSGQVVKFVELGSAKGTFDVRAQGFGGLVISSSGNIYTHSTLACQVGTTPLYNFGLADPKTGSFLTASAVTAPAVTDANGSAMLVTHNSSGVPQTVNVYTTLRSFAQRLAIDTNDSIYQYFSTSSTLGSYTLLDLNNTSSTITVPAVTGTNNHLIKYNSGQSAVGFSLMRSVNTNSQSLFADKSGAYFVWRFTNFPGGLANVCPISTTEVVYTPLPALNTGIQATAIVAWSL